MRLFFIALVFWVFNASAQKGIVFHDNVIEAGEITEGGIYHFAWYFKNTANIPLALRSVRGTGSMLIGAFDTGYVAPGDTGVVYGTLATKGWPGFQLNRTLLVTTSDSKSIVLTVRGTVITPPDSLEGIMFDSHDTITNLDSKAANVAEYYNVQPGDILFQDLDCGPACDAIEAVTEGVNGRDFSHCGIVVQAGNEMRVIEAYGDVKATPVDSFFARSKDSSGAPKVLIGRVKEEYGTIADESADIAKQYIGKGYDDAFDMKNDTYYCSELLYECFKKANGGKEFFPLNKMTFNAPGTDKPMPFWVDYFKKLDKQIPEGKPGINPGAMSRSEKIILIKPERL